MVFLDVSRKIKNNNQQFGFTIFEILVVLVGLAILAAIIPWVYSSYAVIPDVKLPEFVVDQKIYTSLLKTDIASAATQLESFKSKNTIYPITNDCLSAESTTNICLRPAQGSAFDYRPDVEHGHSYILYASKTGVNKSYRITNSQIVPIAVSKLYWESISVATGYTCATASDKEITCWGVKPTEQLNSDLNNTKPTATSVETTGSLKVKTVKLRSTSTGYTCVIASDDKVYCWGKNNFGQLGDNSIKDSTIPVAVDMKNASNRSFVSITTSSNHACAMTSDNHAYCWGDNSTGALGNGWMKASPIPVEVPTSYK